MPGGDRGGALHDRPADAADGTFGRPPRQVREDDNQQSGRTMPARQGKPAVPVTPAKHAVGLGLHLCCDLARVRLCRLCNRYLRPADRRLAGVALGRDQLVLDALEQALYDRRPFPRGSLVHHSDRGVQYVSIRYTERLAAAGIEPSVGSVGDSYDNALAETVIGLFKTEVIRRRGPWRHAEAVEFATLKWVDWFNHRRLFEPIGNIPPAEAEARYYAQIASQAMAA